MILRGLIPLLLLTSAAVPAIAADWVVARASQPSQYSLDHKKWTALKAGMTVPNRSWISTGPRGRVVLQRDKDQVTFQPGTLAGVFERAGTAIHTDFAQQTGTLALSIDPKVKPHLSVQTPYLAAVVKGTVFSVTVTDKGAAVGVERGRVEVTDARSGEQTGVSAGQKAAVDLDPKTPMSVTSVKGKVEAIIHVPPFKPAVPARADVDLSTTGATSADDAGPSGETGGAANGSGKGQSSSGHGEGGSRDNGVRGNRQGNNAGGNDNGNGNAEGKDGNGNAGNNGNGNNGNGNNGNGNNGNGNNGNGNNGNNGNNGKGNAYGHDKGDDNSKGRGNRGNGHND